MLRSIVPLAAVYFILIGGIFVRLIPVPEAHINTFSTVSPTPTPIPTKKIVNNSYHIFQSFNNCGPASLSMALSYFGIKVSQEELGESLRPYQNLQGNNDDKSVELSEMAEKSKEYHLIPFHRPNGSIMVLKKFIANNIPVITRTWLHSNEDIGHYRLIVGYDDESQTIVQDDSFQGNDIPYSYDEFNNLWSKFNYEYLVLVPIEKEQLAHGILGGDADESVAWNTAARNARAALIINPDDPYIRFNLSVALYHEGDFEGSIKEYEAIQNRLPFRTLWYQQEPIKAYFNLGMYDRIFTITDTILNNGNRAYTEMYLIRGESYKKQGNKELAKQEFEKALFYNKNLKSAQFAMNHID